jgi:imidazolonepropionase-like amidohydrolase
MSETGHQNNSQTSILIRNGTVFDGTGVQGRRADVLIENGRFARISETAIEPQGGITTIDARGKTVLPGLIDMHAHLISGGFDTVSEKSMSYDPVEQNRALMQMLYWGVTAVYSPVQPLKGGLELRESVRRNDFPSPRLFISGPGFTAPEGWAGSNLPSARMEPRDAAEARDQVAELADAGVDILKAFYDSMDSAFSIPVPKLRKDLMEAVIAAAHERQLRVMVHVYDTQGHKDVINAGGDIMAHSAITAPVDEEYVDAAKRHNTLYLSTLCVYHDVFDEEVIREYISQDFVLESVPRKTLETLTSDEPLNSFERSIKQANIKRLLPNIMENLRTVFRAGIPLGVGPDTGVPGAFPGLAVHREMDLMVRAGIPPEAVLVAATRTAAQYLGQAGLGTIEPGKIADAVIVDGNPAEDIKSSVKIHVVLKDGMIVDREKLRDRIMQPV